MNMKGPRELWNLIFLDCLPVSPLRPPGCLLLFAAAPIPAMEFDGSGQERGRGEKKQTAAESLRRFGSENLD